jgi:hypothetical protein
MSGRISRRGLLSRLGLAAGAVGVTGSVVAQSAGAKTRVPRVVHGADWRVVWPDVKPGEKHPVGATRLPRGKLVDTGGARLGSFESSVMSTSGKGRHMHHLEFDDGTITAVGPATFDDATYAVVGGTGRFAGASGSYHLVQRPAASGGSATFTFDVTTPEA